MFQELILIRKYFEIRIERISEERGAINAVLTYDVFYCFLLGGRELELHTICFGFGTLCLMVDVNLLDGVAGEIEFLLHFSPPWIKSQD